MLRVKHRHVLADDDFQPLGGNRGAEGKNLLRRTIVGDCHAAGARPQQPVHAQFVRGVQREIGDKRRAPLAAERGRRQVAGKQPVRPKSQQRLDRRHLAGFLHSRARPGGRRLRRPGPEKSPRPIVPRRGDRQ